MIWFSERDNWGQLYLYDLTTGKLEEPDHDRRRQRHAAAARRREERARSTSRASARRRGAIRTSATSIAIGMDGKDLHAADARGRRPRRHAVAVGQVLRRQLLEARTCRRRRVLRDADGKLVLTLEKARHLASCVATGWKPPMPITVKARDGKTDLYGLMYKPTNLDPTKKYPIINHIYPGPQTGSVGGRTFSPARGDAQALAELGFVVVEIDGMGTPWRSKAFHEAYYGNMGDNTLPDQVAGMKELAQRYPWIDIDRAGIYGHSGGGFATADAMFRYPDFFKVGISESGNHDNRDYEDDWGEKLQGLLETNGRRHDELRQPGQSEPREEPEGQAAARARHDGQQRAAVQHAARRRRADQGEQGLRSAHAAEPAARLRQRAELHDAPPLGLLREEPARRRAAEGVRARSQAGGSSHAVANS